MEIEDLISIGIIKTAIGNNGSLSIIPETDFPEHFKDLSEIFVVFSDNTVRLESIESFNIRKNNIIIKFKNINNRTKAMNLKKARLMVTENELHSLEDDKNYHFNLDGFSVITKDNEMIGKIESIFSTNAHDILVIKNSDKEILIPFCDNFIQKILKHDKKIIINPIEGLLDAN